MPYITLSCREDREPLTVHYETWGAVAVGIPVLLIHELGGTLESFRRLAEHVGRNHYVVAYDQRGAGLSEKPSLPFTTADLADDIGRIVEELSIPRPYHVVGVAMGALTALEFAVAQHDELASLVLCDATHAIGESSRTYLAKQAVAVRSEGMRFMAARTCRTAFHGMPGLESDAAFRAYEQRFLSNAPQGFAAHLEALAGFDLDADDLAKVRCPTLCLTGEHDAIWAKDKGRALASMLPRSMFEGRHGRFAPAARPVPGRGGSAPSELFRRHFSTPSADSRWRKSRGIHKELRTMTAAIPRAFIRIISTAALLTSSIVALAQDFHLGALVSLDGPASFVGISAQQGMKVAVDVINRDPDKYLGAKSRSLSVDIRNAGATNAQALTLAREFAETQKVLAILVPCLSPLALALGPFAQQASIPLLIMHSPAADRTVAGNYVFAIAQDGESLAAHGAGTYLKKYPDAKRAGIIYGSDNQGNVLIAQAATRAFKAGDVDVTQFSLPFASLDFSNAIDAMRRANVQVIYLGQGSPAITAAVQQAERIGFKPRYVGYGTMAAPTVLKNVGPALDGSIIATDYDPNLGTPANKVFVDAYRKATNAAPDTYAAQGYATVMIVADALRSHSGAPTRAQLAAGLARLRNIDSVLGAGTFAFTTIRTAASPPALLQVAGGELKSYKP
jgi:ABC-type branched-subunit amino acid transport system substrate-binding protein/pimeloyl-ACP methyl ester carboxylesterase